MTAFMVLRDKVLFPLLAAAGKLKYGRKSGNRSEIDIHYDNIRIEMQNIFKLFIQTNFHDAEASPANHENIVQQRPPFIYRIPPRCLPRDIDSL